MVISGLLKQLHMLWLTDHVKYWSLRTFSYKETIQGREMCIKLLFQMADYREGLQKEWKRKIWKHSGLAGRRNITWTGLDYSDCDAVAFCHKKKVLINSMEK